MMNITDGYPGSWFTLDPDPSMSFFWPRLGVPVWLTDGDRTSLAVRVGDSAPLLFQTILGFDAIVAPTHFAYAAPKPPTGKDE